MTLPEHDDSLSQRDRLPPNERGQDEERTEISRGLTMEQARPMTADERHAAENDTPLAERVYAPASERVPKEPVAGHRTFVEHPDDTTPERQAVAETVEPSFTRVERPSSVETQRSWSPPPMSNPNTYYPSYEQPSGSSKPIGIATIAVAISSAAVGAWVYARWQRERNKPINRFRRQARQTASEVRSRVPNPDELQSRGLGLAATLASIALVYWQKGRQQSQKQVEAVADADWHHRLSALKERWSPRRLEMEKFSISRH
jgi:hypothetical protein